MSGCCWNVTRAFLVRLWAKVHKTKQHCPWPFWNVSIRTLELLLSASVPRSIATLDSIVLLFPILIPTLDPEGESKKSSQIVIWRKILQNFGFQAGRQKSTFYPKKNHILKIPIFTKFTFLKSYFSQYSHIWNLIFNKIHTSEISKSRKFLDKKWAFASVWSP